MNNIIKIPDKFFEILKFFRAIVGLEGPFLVIDALNNKIHNIPLEFLEEDLVLDISKQAVRDLTISIRGIEFTMSFQGDTYNLLIPFDAIKSIYTEEDMLYLD